MATTAEALLLGGFNARTPHKAACDLCSTTNLTLAGEQTIDGGSATYGMRVLATGQTSAVHNGAYVVSTGTWTRVADFSDARSAQMGTTFVVARGTANSGIWRMTAPTIEPITPGVTATTWTKVSEITGHLLALQANSVTRPTAGTMTLTATTVEITGTLTNNGSPIGAAATDALTAKLAARTRSASLTIPSANGAHGGVTTVTGDRVLMDSLTIARDCGIYVSGASAWARASDFNSSADIADGALVSVVEGTDAAKLYQLNQLDAILGTTNLTFTQVGGGGSVTAGDGLTLTASDFDIDLTDTIIFTSAGAASRVPILSGTSMLVAAGVTRTAGAMTIETVTSGPLAISSAGSASVDGTSVTIGAISAGTVAIGRVGGTSVTAYSPSVSIGAGAAANREVHTASGVNHSVVIRDVAGNTASTWLHDDAAVSLTTVGSLSLTSPTTTVTGSSVVYVNGTHFSSTASGGAWTATCSTLMGLNGYGGLELNSAINVCKLGTPAASGAYVQICFPAAVTPGVATPVAIGTITVPASSSGAFTGTVSIRNGAANHEAYDLKFDWNSDATTVTASALTTASRAATVGVIGTAPADVTATVANLVVTILVASASGFRCALRGDAHANL